MKYNLTVEQVTEFTAEAREFLAVNGKLPTLYVFAGLVDQYLKEKAIELGVYEIPVEEE